MDYSLRLNLGGGSRLRYAGSLRIIIFTNVTLTRAMASNSMNLKMDTEVH